MNRADIKQKLVAILLSLKPNLTLENVDDDVNLLKDLGIDSITMLMMALSIEKAFSFRFESLRPDQLQTVGDVCAYIEKRLAS
ncbi:MAG: acyl carrier protein [Clostridia bacterium]|nr:acyl carrier protein [Clostridia bacterium]